MRQMLHLASWRRSATQAAVRGALRLTSWLGAEGALKLGRTLGILGRFAGPLRRRVANNLRRAGIVPTEPILDRYFQHFGCWAGWSLAAYHSGLDGSGVPMRLEFDASVANLDRAVARGKGVVLACPHLFCHEVGAAVIGRRYPVTALIRESHDPAHTAIKQHWYDAIGMRTVRRPRNSSLAPDILACRRVLREGGVLGITPDVLLPADKGSPVRVFGREVFVSPGMVVLAMSAGASLVTPLEEWTPAAPGQRYGYIRMHFGEPIEFPTGGDRERTIREGLQAWWRSIEAYLRREPENWMFWLDKRWTRVLAKPACAL